MVCNRELFHYFRKLSNYFKLEREKENLLVISKAFLLFQSKVFSYQESNRIFFLSKKLHVHGMLQSSHYSVNIIARGSALPVTKKMRSPML